MGKPQQIVFNGDAESFLSDKRVIWLKIPSYGMSDELNRLYHKTKMRQALLNSKTDEDKQSILNVIQMIISDENITFINKLYLIDELIAVNKDYFDNYDSIIDDAIAIDLQNGQ